MYLLLFCYFCLFIFMFKFDLVQKFYALPPSNNERSNLVLSESVHLFSIRRGKTKWATIFYLHVVGILINEGVA